jgi:hypothetical protein
MVAYETVFTSKSEAYYARPQVVHSLANKIWG